ncbi:MAG: dihydrofolate reductase [Verrucomicrobiae bacterium]|nr:dihydrofolate reductase [Verrucomicrobiae bacterium]
MPLIAVVAMASNRVIGRDGDLPWRLSEDLKWFKKLTLGHPIVMGRKTMESLGGRPLPKRRNLVLSRSLDENDLPEGFEKTSADPEILRALDETVSIIGGAEIYRLLLPHCDEVYLSYVFEPHEGDTYLPPFEDDFDLAEIVATYPEFELRRYTRKS